MNELSILEASDPTGIEIICEWWAEAVELNDWLPLCLKLRGAVAFIGNTKAAADVYYLQKLARHRLIESRQ